MNQMLLADIKNCESQIIALTLKECGLIEKYVSGIGRIKKLCNEHGVIELKFEELVHGFKVNLFKEKVNEPVKLVFELIKDNPEITKEQEAINLVFGKSRMLIVFKIYIEEKRNSGFS